MWKKGAAEGGSGIVGSEGFDPEVDAVIVMCGLNDWKHFGKSTPAEFRADLENLTDVLHQAFGAKCHVVLPALPVSWTTAFPQPMRSAVMVVSRRGNNGTHIRSRLCFN